MRLLGAATCIAELCALNDFNLVVGVTFLKSRDMLIAYRDHGLS